MHKNVGYVDESQFPLQHFQAVVRTWDKKQQHESMDASCPVPISGGVIMWSIFSCHTLGPLASIVNHLNATAYLDIIADHIHHF